MRARDSGRRLRVVEWITVVLLTQSALGCAGWGHGTDHGTERGTERGTEPGTEPGTERSTTADRVHLPLLRGWFEGREVVYVTTDVSDADVARAKGANFAPLLANTIPSDAARSAGQRASTAKVYAVTNHEQGSVFGSAPEPVGPANQLAAYSPLWQLVKVTWREPSLAVTLRSEEELLSAQDRALVVLETTRVVLNCPIVKRGPSVLPGTSTDH